MPMLTSVLFLAWGVVCGAIGYHWGYKTGVIEALEVPPNDPK